VLPGSLVKDPRLDYVAMGHIHKAQNLNGPGPDPKDKTAHNHPPVIYPGSIERVDFGEARDDKYFVIADVARGETEVKWHKLKHIRKFIDCYAQLKSAEDVTAQLIKALPKPDKMVDAIVKLTVAYPRDYEKLIHESELRAYTAETFEFHLVKRPQINLRVRLAEDESIAGLPPLDLLKKYWEADHVSDPAEVEALQRLAAQVLDETQTNDTE
jgi:exonuclease SbcD